MIAAQGLSRRFGARVVVDRVTFEVARGEIVALLGPNGAGKTTTMRMLAGLVAATSGRVNIGGTDLTPKTAGVIRRRIGFLTETPGLWDRLTVRENLSVYADLYELSDRRARVDRLLGDFGLTAHAEDRAAELSKGMRQKVAIARTLLHDPDVLLLDEPTSGLDPEIAKSLRQVLHDRRARGGAILISTHNLHEAERHADRIAVLQQRLVAIDTPSRLRARLSTGRVVVRVAGDASRWADAVVASGLVGEADGDTWTFTLRAVDTQTPEVVRALTLAGAAILEVGPELPAMEDVYLHLVSGQPDAAKPKYLP